MPVNPKGYAAPIVRIFSSSGEITSKVTRFNYKHSEKESDKATIVIEELNTNLPDKAEFQEGATLKVIWGYIGGVFSKKRTVTIQNVKASYTRKTISLTLEAYPKAALLKQNSSQKVWKNVTLDDIAREIAEKNGLQYGEVEAEDETDENEDGLTFQSERNALLNHGGIYTTAVATTQTPRERFLVKTPPAEVPCDKVYEEIPQGNMSDYQFLEYIAKLEPCGPYKVEARDNKLIVCKRNLAQTPIRSYLYGKGSAELLEFTPETKTTAKRKSSINTETGGWDPTTKQYMQGNVNEGNVPDVKMGDVVEGTARSNSVSTRQEQRQREVDSNAKPIVNADPILSGRTIEIPIAPGVIAIVDAAEAERLKKLSAEAIANGEPTIIDRAFFTIDRSSPALLEETHYTSSEVDNTNVVEDVVGGIDYGEHLDTIEQQLEDIYAEGANKKADAALEKNPAKGLFLGDPRVVSGIIINIQNVSKKYSGNYYVMSADHSVQTSSGYLMNLELRKNALGKTGNETGNKIETANKQNKTVGPDETKEEKEALVELDANTVIASEPLLPVKGDDDLSKIFEEVTPTTITKKGSVSSRSTTGWQMIESDAG